MGLCKACESVLKNTSSIIWRRTTLETSYRKIRAGSNDERCFVCKAVYDAILDPDSGFHPISKLEGLAIELKNRRVEDFVLGFGVEIGGRPMQGSAIIDDVILSIHWRFSFTEPCCWFNNDQIKFFFCPVDRDQKPDGSWAMDGGESENGKFNFVPRRLFRNLYCPDCKDENLSEAQFRKFLSNNREDYKEQTVEEIEEERSELGSSLSETFHSRHGSPQEGNANAHPQDWMRLDLEMNYTLASNNTGSDQSWAQIESWLDVCHRTHANCPKPTGENNAGPTEYPTRLLELGLLQDLRGPLRLVETKDANPQGHYVTLSHCWGEDAVLSLTTDNFDSYLKNVDFEELPKTFQDAVVIARKLRIQYLWIDSLCIIQEGPDAYDDWLRESLSMSRVYRNAFLNIGATGASNPKVGCFRERDYRDVHRPVIEKEECLTHCGKFYHSYRLIEESFVFDCLFKEPLLQRGWVFQERFLAPRMIHFGSNQLFWECKEMWACESFPTHILSSHDLASLTSLEKKFKKNDGLVKAVGLYHWYTIVEQYTSKTLKKSEDKLIAISGVAEQYQKALLEEDDQYWAGVWLSDLPGGLLWTVKNGDGRRPGKYRAPSWSWASVDGVILPPRFKETTGRYLVTLGTPWFDYVSESNPFGPLNSAPMGVRTRLVTVQCVKKQGEDGDKSAYVFSFDGVEIDGSFWYPDEPVESPVFDITCLCFSTGESGMAGITLKRVIVEDEEDNDTDEMDAEESGTLSQTEGQGGSGTVDSIAPKAAEAPRTVEDTLGDEDSGDKAQEKQTDESGDEDEEQDETPRRHPRYERTGVFRILPSEGAGADWVCPVAPFAALRDLDPEQEPWLLVI